jgi:hypothetical protein
MARGTSRAQSERTQSLLGVPGPAIASRVKDIIDSSSQTFPGNRFITAMNLVKEMTEDAKSGRQVSLTALSVAQSEMARLKNESLTEGYNEPMSAMAESMRNRLDVTQNKLALTSNPTTYYSSYDTSDSSGQTYDQRMINEKGKKLEYATEAMKILRNAPEEFAKMKVADVEGFVNDYVKMNLKGSAQEKFKGIKWSIRSYPD